MKEISIYNLAHNEIDDNCCGIFDRINDDGIIYCNECGKTMRDVVLDNIKPKEKTKLKNGDKVKIKKGLEWRFYYANGMIGEIINTSYSPNQPYLVQWPRPTCVSYKEDDLELVENNIIDSYSIC